MLPLSSSLFTPSDHQWWLDNSINHDLDPMIFSTSDQPSDNISAKKLNHNASERDRRKKINYLYSSLRSLLPQADQLKKLSNPSTISRIVKYIPELRQEVEELQRKKEEIQARKQAAVISDQIPSKREKRIGSHFSANRLNEREILIQISTKNDHPQTKNRLSETLVLLENDGFLLLNASSFLSLQGSVFFNLHLQVDTDYILEAETLSEKLLKQPHRSIDYFRA